MEGPCVSGRRKNTANGSENQAKAAMAVRQEPLPAMEMMIFCGRYVNLPHCSSG
jgi:hypothetical protein